MTPLASVRRTLARIRSGNINLARINHIFIPTTKDERDRLRNSRLGRVLKPMQAFVESFSAEGRMVAFIVVVSGFLGLEIRRTQTHVLWATLSALLFLSLVWGRFFRLRDVELEAQAPRRVTLGEPLAFTLILHNRGTLEHQALRFRGPFLPWDGKWLDPRPRLRRVAPGSSERVTLRARFVHRGEHHLDPFQAAALVPLGLALGPSIVSGGTKFLVVPRIANVAQCPLPRSQVHQPGGVALASRTGESMDLSGIRAYRPGDPLRDLHARSWARTGIPVVREYSQEYFTRVALLLDTDLGDDGPRLFEGALSLAAGLLAHLTRGEALVDLIVVPGTHHRVTLGRGLGTLDQAMDLLACIEPGEKLRADAVLSRLEVQLPAFSSVLFVALRWDEERIRLQKAVAQRGPGTASYVPTLSSGIPPRAHGRSPRLVPISSIESGEALVL